MRIAIIGAGALGLYYGSLLQRAGEDVHFLLRRDYEAIAKNGLTVESINGNFHLQPVNSYIDSSEIGTVDLVLIGLKTFNNDQMNLLVRPLVDGGTTILSLQNGLGNEQVLAAEFPPQKIMGGVAFLCANRGEPGLIRHLGQGAVRIGHYRGSKNEAGERISKTLAQAGIDCDYVDDLLKARWEKLVWNIPFNGLCALIGQTVTDILKHPPSRRLAIDIMQEVINVANAQPISSPIVSEPFIDRMIAATETMEGYRPSMMIDRQEGRQLELDSIYVKPLAAATDKSVSTPSINMLYALLDLNEPD